MIMMIVTWQKEEEARESQECNVFDKVNGLRVALCFGGCRVLGCINSCGFHGVRISGSRLTSAYISPLFTSEVFTRQLLVSRNLHAMGNHLSISS